MRRHGGNNLSAADDLVLLHYANKIRCAELKEHHAEVIQPCLEAIDREMQRTRAMEALQTLPAVEAVAVTVVVLCGHEIAQQSNISAMTIQRRLKRDLERLSKPLNRL